MNPDYGTTALCQRHPSQTSTGFCSSCLIERLSAVDTADRSSKNTFFTYDSWKQDYPAADTNALRKSSDIRPRRTLQYLFQLDNDFGNGHAIDSYGEPESSAALRFLEYENGSEDRCEIQIERNENNFRTRNAITETGSSSQDKICENSKVMKEKGLYFWIDSTFSRRRSKRATISKLNLKEPSELEKSQIDRSGQNHSEMDSNAVISTAYKRSSGSDKAAWEDPRHSWDGVMANKASCPPFLDIREHRNVSFSHSKRKSLAEEVMSVDSASSSDTKSVRMETTANASAEVVSSADTDLVNTIRSKFSEEAQQVNITKKFRRRHWCGKAWYRSITSPWRDLFGRRSSLFHRSLSESWREDCKWRNAESVKVEDGVKFNETNNSVARPCDSSRSGNATNSDVQRTRPNSQSRDIRFGRSQSLHYSSPGNVESGLLRFYLTPLRRSRRATGRKTSGSFTRGILRL